MSDILNSRCKNKDLSRQDGNFAGKKSEKHRKLINFKYGLQV